MKKTITILCTCILFSLAAQSQITKGNWMAGGNANFSADYIRHKSEGIPSTRQSTVTISPDIGYFLADKLAAGLNADFSLQPFTNGTGEEETSVSFNLRPSIRYYFLPTQNIINVVTGVAYEHWFRNKYTLPSNTYSLFAGPSFFFNSNVAAELFAGIDYTESPQGTTRTFKMNIGFQIYLKK